MPWIDGKLLFNSCEVTWSFYYPTMSTAVVWFRQDLRVTDNPALMAACQEHDNVIPVYIHAPQEMGQWRPGAASQWWLHHSLKSLDSSLQELGSRLFFFSGNSKETLQSLITSQSVSAVYWNRLYEPEAIKRDTGIKQVLQENDVQVQSFKASLLYEPWQVVNQAKKPYRVFTPFWKTVKLKGIDLPVLGRPNKLVTTDDLLSGETKLKCLGLLPEINWDSNFYDSWKPGETGASRSLKSFLKEAVEHYEEQRDIPGVTGTSRLSPHLHFGEISPAQIVRQVFQKGLEGSKDAQRFLSEVGWREFGYHLLYHFPETTIKPLNSKFVNFPWAEAGSSSSLIRWQQGQTGIPIVDAGMRELWQTGWMHNRVRMIVASLLTKNCRIHWLEGARWFWDTLVDADLASNTLGWQWVAGSGADAAPYFRIFNPVRQGQRFDPDGTYVRQWVPEISRLPDKYLHSPWEAPKNILQEAGLQLGQNYPLPVVDLGESRKQALAVYNKIKN